MTPTLLVHTPLCINHRTGDSHPESPQRYLHIMKELRKLNLFEVPITTPCSIETLLLCHEQEYIDLVRDACLSLKKDAVSQLITGDVDISHDSFTAARTAVSAALYAVDAVMKGENQNAFVITRPPGHHAKRSRGMGFCLFNTVAIAARYLQNAYNSKKVAIIDWDGHHGNGTASLFLHDPSVLYISTHQKGAYPGTGNTSCDTSINFPVSSRKEIFSFFETAIPRFIARFKPECILISCGFDAHRLDPLLSLDLESEDFGALTRGLCDLAKTYCSGRIVSILEGGYHLNALEESASSHVQALLATN